MGFVKGDHLRKRPIYISLIGGFGNNLFQVAFAKRLEQNGFNVKFDFSAKKGINLELYEIPYLCNYVKSRKALWTLFFPNPIGKLARLSKFLIKWFINSNSFIDLQSNGKAPDDLSKGYFLTGYWQTLENANILRTLKLLDHKVYDDVIAVHVRRGDMKSNIDHPLDTYYRNAVNLVISSNPGQQFQVFVYTDDPIYCLEWLDLGCVFDVVQGGTTVSDFLEMISSSHLIISRSTYSLWAGYFSINNVYFPSPWEIEDLVSDSHVIPTDWNRVSTEN